MQLEIFLSPLNGVWVGGMRQQIRGKARNSPIQLTFRGVWARELGRNETYLSIKFRGRDGGNVQLLRTFFP